MTREETLKLIDCLKAHIDGKTLQCKTKAGWEDVSVEMGSIHAIIEYPESYRIKPEPREFWINKYAFSIHAYDNKLIADSNADNSRRLECIHVREVID